MEAVYKVMPVKFAPYLLLLVLELLELTECISQAEIKRHLELGKQFLEQGQLGEALNHYHSAIDGDPNNYLTYFQRGTVYLALGKANKALSDIDKTLEIKPDFTSARIRRGSIHLKLGDYDLAQLDFYNVLQIDPYNEQANNLLHLIEPAKQNLELAYQYYAHNDYVNAISFLNPAIETSPWAAKLFEFRAELHQSNGDAFSASFDMSNAAKLYNDNTKVYFKLSQLLYHIGDATNALKAIRECLKLDPDDKQCFPFYKRLKKVEKFLTSSETALENKELKDAISDALQVLKLETKEDSIVHKAQAILCTSYVQDHQSDEAINACTKALRHNDDQNLDLYCERAEAYLQLNMYDDAIADYNIVLKIDNSYKKAQEGLQRAKQSQKDSERRDYYKILNVDRRASKAQIVKAYRKMAQKWHPDQFQNDEKMKKIAEAKFIDIGAAKEVLTDDEKRKQFDAGEDPLDPESGNHQYHQANQHFRYFHDNAFHFKMHF